MVSPGSAFSARVRGSRFRIQRLHERGRGDTTREEGPFYSRVRLNPTHAATQNITRRRRRTAYTNYSVTSTLVTLKRYFSCSRKTLTDYVFRA